jgi:hypothetical protein
MEQIEDDCSVRSVDSEEISVSFVQKWMRSGEYKKGIWVKELWRNDPAYYDNTIDYCRLRPEP